MSSLAPLASSGHGTDLGAVPPDYFVIKLYQMLREQREVLSWDPDGGIVIRDRQRLEATLSVYFRHNRFTSFQRQLNNFGFHKKRRTPGSGEALRRGEAAYDHPLLRGEQPEAVLRLRRDARPRHAADAERRAREAAALQAPAKADCLLLASLADVASSALNRESGSDSPSPERSLHMERSSSSSASDDQEINDAASASDSADGSHDSGTNSGNSSESPGAIARRSLRAGPRGVARALPELFSAAARPRRARPFPCVLKDMIDQTPDSVICWSADGRCFAVGDAETLCRDVLPKYFRHCRLASFQRQLSLYQFRRARLARPAPGAPPTLQHAPPKTGGGGGLPLAYSHPAFTREVDEEGLRCITRAAPKSPGSPQSPRAAAPAPFCPPPALAAFQPPPPPPAGYPMIVRVPAPAALAPSPRPSPRPSTDEDSAALTALFALHGGPPDKPAEAPEDGGPDAKRIKLVG